MNTGIVIDKAVNRANRVARWWDRACRYCRMIRRVAGYTVRCLASVFVFVGLVQIGYWMVGSPWLLVVHSGAIISRDVAAGSEMVVVWDVTKPITSENCTGKIHRYITGTTQSHRWIDLGDVHIEQYEHVLGAHIPVTITVRLPSDMEPGLWFYQSEAVYACNPVQYLSRKRIVFPSIPFTVRQ